MFSLEVMVRSAPRRRKWMGDWRDDTSNEHTEPDSVPASLKAALFPRNPQMIFTALLLCFILSLLLCLVCHSEQWHSAERPCTQPAQHQTAHRHKQETKAELGGECILDSCLEIFYLCLSQQDEVFGGQRWPSSPLAGVPGPNQWRQRLSSLIYEQTTERSPGWPIEALQYFNHQDFS